MALDVALPALAIDRTEVEIAHFARQEPALLEDRSDLLCAKCFVPLACAVATVEHTPLRRADLILIVFIIRGQHGLKRPGAQPLAQQLRGPCHLRRALKKVLQHLAVQLPAIRRSALVARVEAGDIERFQGGAVGVAVLSCALLQEVSAQKLKEFGQLPDTRVGGRQALLAVPRDDVTGQDQFVTRPLWAARCTDPEPFALEPLNRVAYTSAQLLPGEVSAVLVLVGHGRDGLGVVLLAVVQDEELPGRFEAVQAQERRPPISSYSCMVFRTSSREITPFSMSGSVSAVYDNGLESGRREPAATLKTPVETPAAS